MKVLSLKLREDVFEETEKVIHQIHSPRNSYINEAVSFYNKLQKRRLLKKQLHKEAGLIRPSSLEVLHEFERIEDSLPE